MKAKVRISRRTFIKSAVLSATAIGSSLRVRPAFSVERPDDGLGEIVEACLRVPPFRSLHKHVPIPFEMELIRKNQNLRSALKDTAIGAVRSGFDAGLFGSPEVLDIPKPVLPGMRQYAVLEPMDALVFNSLCVQLAREFEGARPRLEEKVVFSSRLDLAAKGVVSGTDAFPAFLDRVKRSTRMGDTAYILRADIADFYRSVSLQSIETILSQYCCNENSARYVLQLLGHWETEYGGGLPIGPVGSSLLAEAVLLPVDRALIKGRFDYCRFSDDFTVFTSNKSEALDALGTLDDAVRTVGLSLNAQKTAIFSKRLRAKMDTSKIIPTTGLDEIPTSVVPLRTTPLGHDDTKAMNDSAREKLYVLAMESGNVRDTKKWMREAIFSPRLRHLNMAARHAAENPQLLAYFINALTKALRTMPQSRKERVLADVGEHLLDEAFDPFVRLKGFALVRGSTVGASRAKTFLRRGDTAISSYVHRMAIEALGPDAAASSIAGCFVDAQHGWCRRAALRSLLMSKGKSAARSAFTGRDAITQALVY